jgi:enoyl-CoA hydratase/carnithine racemase
VALSKRLLWSTATLDADAVEELETEYHHLVMGAPDAREGVMAWIEEREPHWTGRVSELP